MLTLSTDVMNARVKAVGDWIDRPGVNPGSVIQFYSGTRPGALGEITDQELLCELNFPNPCYSDAVNGELLMNDVPDGQIQLTGDATWARILDADGAIVGDLDVSGKDGVGDLKMPTVLPTVYQGATMRLIAWKLK